MIYNLIVNTLKSIFRPLPDMRYKFELKDNIVINSLDNMLFPLHLKEDYNIEIEIDGKLKTTLGFENGGNKISLCGLPIVAYSNLTLNIIDTLDGECIKSYSYDKGEIINYMLIFKENDILLN